MRLLCFVVFVLMLASKTKKTDLRGTPISQILTLLFYMGLLDDLDAYQLLEQR